MLAVTAVEVEEDPLLAASVSTFDAGSLGSVALLPAFTFADGDIDAGDQYTLTTEYGKDGTATAVLSLRDDVERIDTTLQSFSIELRLGSSVFGRYEVLVDITEGGFAQDFVAGRLAEAGSDDVEVVGSDEAEDWLSRVAVDGSFSDLPTGVTSTYVKERNELASVDRVVEIAVAQKESLAGETELLASASDKVSYYQALERASQTVAAEAASRSSDGKALAESLGRTALLMSETLREDLASDDKSVVAAATAARDQILATVDPYYTVFTGLGKNQLLQQESDARTGAQRTIHAVEEGSIAIGSVRLELGDYEAMVQVTSQGITTYSAVSSAPLVADFLLPPGNDATVDSLNQTTNDNGTSLTAALTAIASEQRSLLEFDLAQYAGDVPNAAELSLTTTAAPASSVDLELAVHSDLWGIDPSSAWDESTVTWANYATDLASGFGLGVEAWAVNTDGTTTLDVTAQVQRALVFGDANLNGEFDPYGPNGDVAAFYLAVQDFTAYSAQYGTQEVSGLANGLVYRNDANLDNVVDKDDAAQFFDRVGTPQGDFNLDGAVDLRDYSLWADHYGQLASSFTVGDGDLSGVVDVVDLDIWASTLGAERTDPTAPSLTFEVSATSVGSVSFHSSESATAPPELAVDMESTVRITDFTADGDDFNLIYDVKYDDAVNPEISIYQVVDGVETLLISGVSVNGAEGAGKNATIAASGTILNPGQEFTLVAKVSSDNGLTTTKTLESGAFKDDTGAWFVIGSDGDDAITASPTSVMLNSVDVTPTGGAPSAIYVYAAGGADQVFATPSDATALYLNGGAGDDTYTPDLGTTSTASVTIEDHAGIDKLVVTDWAEGLSTSTPLDLTSTAVQTLVSADGDNLQLQLGGAYTVELLTGVSQDAIAGPGYTAPITVSTVYDDLDGDHSEGELSLREALALADAIDNPFNPAGETIEFDARLFDFGPVVIDLAAAGPLIGFGQLKIESDVIIQGPGADLLTIDGGDATRAFYVDPWIDVTLTDLTVSDGSSAGSYGGGLYSFRSDLTLERTVWTGNYANKNGGAVYLREGNLTVIDSTFEGNTTSDSGGGVFFYNTGSTYHELLVSGSTFNYNYSTDRGHGLAVYSFVGNGASALIENSTFSQNSGSQGGAVWVQGSAGLDVEILNSTIAENHTTNSAHPGGVWNNSTTATLTINNSIIAGNTDGSGYTPSDLYNAGVLLGTHNLYVHSGGSDTTFENEATNQKLTDYASAGLSAFGDYGGPTQTYSLLTGSPAIDAGDDSLLGSLVADQRGHLRAIDLDDDPATGNVDIGAFEVQPPRIEIVDFRAENEQLIVEYLVHGATAQPLTVLLHTTESGAELGTLLDTIEITDPGMWTDGLTHSFAFTPDFSATDIEEDYYLSAGVAYSSTTLANSNQLLLESGLFVESDGTVHLHGSKTADQVTVTATSIVSPQLLAAPFVMAAGTAVAARLHEGNDELLVSGTGSAAVLGITGPDDDCIWIDGSQGGIFYGSAGDDCIVGDEHDNVIYAGLGNDRIEGGGGNDTLRGERGDDTYVFNGSGDLGEDLISDSYGNDTLDFSGMAESIVVDLSYYSPYSAQQVSSTLGLSLLDVENVIGTVGDDVVVGDSEGNRLDGNGGTDLLEGQGGNDTYVVRDNVAVDATLQINDSAGVDFLDFSHWSGDALPLSLGSADTQTLSPPWGSAQVVVDFAAADQIEAIVGVDDVTSGLAPGYASGLVVTEFHDALDGADIAPGDGLTLREALAIAQADYGPNTIEFDLGGVNKEVISLDSALGPLTINGDGTIPGGPSEGEQTEIVIEGPGRDALDISGGGQVNVLSIAHGVAATLSGLTIRDGYTTSGMQGGGVTSFGDLTLIASSLVDNESLLGGGLQARYGNAVITGTVFEENTAESGGGAAVMRAASLLIEDSHFRENVADNDYTWGTGGALHVTATPIQTIRESTFVGNTAKQAGGAIFSVGADEFRLEDTEVAFNTAGANPSENQPFYVQGLGGGIALFRNNTSTIVGSSIHGNSAIYSEFYDGLGGGIFVDEEHGDLEISNTTISSNTATLGGGVYLSNGTTPFSEGFGVVTLTNATVAHNVAVGGQEVEPGVWDGGGGVYVTDDAHELKLLNTILADNTNGASGASDLDGALVVSSSRNLIGPGLAEPVPGSAGELLAPGEATGLLPLGAYGGTGASHALERDSPAIDAADTSISGALDQRGFLRSVDGDGVNGAAADIGAYEYQADDVLWVNTPEDSDVAVGELSLRQALALAEALPGTQTIRFATSVFSSPQTITLEHDDPNDGDATADPLLLSSDVVIVGPGDELLTVATGDAGRAFEVGGPIEVSLSGLTIDDVQTTASQANTAPIAVSQQHEVLATGVLTVAAADGLVALATDADGPQALQAVLVDDVEHGTLVLNLDGSFEYTPDPLQAGVQRFRYQLFDGFDFSEPRHVSISVRAVSVGLVEVASDDTWVDPDNQSSPQGGSSTINVGEPGGDLSHGFFKFDVSPYLIDSANLFVNAYYESSTGSSRTVELLEVNDASWDESALTYDDNLQGTTANVELGALSGIGDISLDITAGLSLPAAVADSVLTLMLTKDNTNEVSYRSKEYTPGDTSDAPRLVIDGAELTPILALQNERTSIREDGEVAARTAVANLALFAAPGAATSFDLTAGDTSLFELDGQTLYLKAGVDLNYEQFANAEDAQLEVTVTADVIGYGTVDVSHTIDIVDVNEKPTIQLQNEIPQINEGTDTGNGLKVADIVLSDDALGTNSLELTGPHDHKFQVVETELWLKAGEPIDYESLGEPHELLVTVAVNDPSIVGTPDSSVDLVIPIVDADEAPEVLLSNVVSSLGEIANASGRVRVADFSITDDAIGTLSAPELTGTDAASFEIDGDSIFLLQSAVLSAASSPLEVTLYVEDSTTTLSGEQSLTIAITDSSGNSAPTIALANEIGSVSEAYDTSYRRKVADIVVADDGIGVNELSLSGTDVDKFEIENGALYLKAGVELDASAADLSVSVEVDDLTVGASPDAGASFTLGVTAGESQALYEDAYEDNDALPEAYDLGTITSFSDDLLTIYDGVLVGEDVVFVIDVSGSTDHDDPTYDSTFAGTLPSPTDRNDDGEGNDVLDAEIAALQTLLDDLIDRGLGDDAKVSVLKFNEPGNGSVDGFTVVDLDPSNGGTVDAVASPNEIVASYTTILPTIQGGGGTHYTPALAEALQLAVDEQQTTAGNIIFLSDGEPKDQGYGELADDIRSDHPHINLRAFGVLRQAPLPPSPTPQDIEDALVELREIDPNATNFADAADLLDVFDGGVNMDVDYFKFTAEHTGDMVARIDFVGADGDVDLEVLTAAGVQHGTLSAPSGDAESVVFSVTQGQDYVVKVSGEDNFYDLSITLEGSLLIEGTQYANTYEQTIQRTDVATKALSLSFADLEFDTTDQDGVPDAFELVLLDGDGKPAITPVAAGYEAFFNITEGQSPRLGDGVAYDDATGSVTFGVSHLDVGADYTLVARLANTDGLPGDTDTLTRVRVVPGVTSHTNWEAPARLPTAASIDYGSFVDADPDSLHDVSAGFDVDYELSTLNQSTSTHHIQLSVSNNGLLEVRDSLLIGLKSPTQPISLINADGVTDEGIQYIDISGLAFTPGNAWNAAGDRADGIDFEIFNPLGDRFDYELVILGELNESPEFTSNPRFFDTGQRLVEAPVGVDWSFDADAIDPDGDSLTYSIVSGPVEFDDGSAQANGVVTWTPAQAVVGMQFPVHLRVSDGKGGFDDLTFTLVATDPAENRAPEFDVTPVVEAFVNTEYGWTAMAIDVDGDSPLYFRLDPTMSALPGVGGDDLSIDESTGEISWTPRPEDVNKTFRVQLEVFDRNPDTDPLALKGELDFDLRVFDEPGNHDPYFTSQPGDDSSPLTAGHVVVAPAIPDATPLGQDLVEPDALDLVLEAGERQTETVSVTLSADQKSADIVFVVDASSSMGGAHAWLGSVVTEIEAGLVAAGVTNNRYALTRFGISNLAPEVVTGYDGYDPGEEFVTAAALGSLIGPDGLGVTAGYSGNAAEDGFAGLSHALEYFHISEMDTVIPFSPIRADAAKTFVLITDEGREANIYMPDSGLDDDALALQGELAALGVSLDAVVWSYFRSDGGGDNLGDFKTGHYNPGTDVSIQGDWSLAESGDAYLATASATEPVAVSTVQFDSADLSKGLTAADRGLAVLVAEIGVDGTPPVIVEDSKDIAPDVFVAYDYIDSTDFRWIGFTAGSKYLKAGSYADGIWNVSRHHDLSQVQELGLTSIVAGDTYELRFELEDADDSDVNHVFFNDVLIGTFSGVTDGVDGVESVGVGATYRDGFEDGVGRFESFAIIGNQSFPDGLGYGPYGRVVSSLRFGDQGGSAALGVGASRVDGLPDRGYLPTIVDNGSGPEGDFVVGVGGENLSDWSESYLHYDDEALGPEFDSGSIEDYVDLAWSLGGAAWDINYLRGHLSTPSEELARESFSKAFVAGQVDDIIDRLRPKIVSSSPAFVGYTPVIPEGSPEDFLATEFEVLFEGDGNPHAEFHLDVVRSTGVGVYTSLGTVPVTVNAPYVYELDASDPDVEDNDNLTFAFAPGSATYGATIEDMNRLVWSAQDQYWADVPDVLNPTPVSYNFHLIVTDGRGGIGEQEFTVTIDPSVVSNVAPQFGLSSGGGLSDVDFPLVDAGDASSPRRVALTESGVYRAYQPLSFKIPAFDSDLGDQPRFYLTDKPHESMSIDRTSGEVTWTPGPEHVGDRPFSVRITDGRGGVTEQTFVITIAGRERGDHKPALLGIPPASVDMGDTLAFDFNHYDADGDSVEYFLVAGPDGMAIDRDSGKLRWEPTQRQIGSHSYVVAIEDSEGTRSVYDFNIEVTWAGRIQFLETPSPTGEEVGLGNTYFFPLVAYDDVTGSLADFTPDESTLPTGATYTTVGPHGPGFYWTPTVDDGFAVNDQVSVTMVFEVGTHVIASFALITVDGETREHSWQIEIVDPTTIDDPLAAPLYPQFYSIGDPSAEEQLMLEIINRARVDGPAEANRIAALYGVDADITSAMDGAGITKNEFLTAFGDDVNYGAQNVSTQPLSFQSELLAIAGLHSQDLLDNGVTDDDFGDPDQHLSSGLQSPFAHRFDFADRLGEFKYHDIYGIEYSADASISENVYAEALSIEHGHAGFEVEWNVGTNGHRLNLHSADWKEVGIGIVEEVSPPASPVGPLVITENFSRGRDSYAYITGVVYEDRDGDGFYDVGEGIPGVRVDVENAFFYAITTSSGGYSIPVGATGAYTVTYSRDGITTYEDQVNVDEIVGPGGAVLQNVRSEFEVSAHIGKNHPPVLESPPRQHVAVGQQWSWRPAVTDPDGDHLAEVDWASIIPSWASQSPDDPGLYLGTPEISDLGTEHTIVFTIDDGRGGVLDETFTITVGGEVLNTQPSIVSQNLPSAVVDQLYTLQLEAEDVDNDAVFWDLTEAPGDATIGFDSTKGVLTWTPSDLSLGDNYFRVVASDGLATTQPFEFVINVRGANTPARLIDFGPPQQVIAGEEFEYRLAAEDPDAFDGDLRFGFIGGDHDWLRIDPRTGEMFGTAPDNPGALAVTVYVTDQTSINPQDAKTFTLEILPVGSEINRAPTIGNAPIPYAYIGQDYVFTPVISDDNGGAPDWNVVAALSEPNFVKTADSVVWDTTTLPAGPYELVIDVTDPQDPAVVGRYRWTVLLDSSTNSAPAIDVDALPSGEDAEALPGTVYQTVLTATDIDGHKPTFALVDPPSGVSISEQGLLTWEVPLDEPLGLQAFTVVAIDRYGAPSMPEVFSVEIISDDQPPVLAISASSTAEPIGGFVHFTTSASDNVGIADKWITVSSPTAGDVIVPLRADGTASHRFDTEGTYTVTLSAVEAAAVEGAPVASEALTVDIYDPADVEAPVPVITWNHPALLEGSDPVLIDFSVSPGSALGDPNLINWRLELFNDGHGEPIELLDSGSGVMAGEQYIDPFAIPDGLYELRLVASYDGSARLTRTYRHAFSVDTGGYKVGQFAVSFSDLSVPVGGIPLTFSRSYDSTRLSTSGDFGPGWSLELLSKATIAYGFTPPDSDAADEGSPDVRTFEPPSLWGEGSEIHITLPGGTVESFRLTPQWNGGQPTYNARLDQSFATVQVVWEPLGGTTSELSSRYYQRYGYMVSEAGNGAPDSNAILLADTLGTPYNPIRSSPFSTGAFNLLLTTADGYTFDIDTWSGAIQSITAPDQTSLEIRGSNLITKDSDGRITSTSIVERGLGGRIERIIQLDDPTDTPAYNDGKLVNGRSVEYLYDDNGNLSHVIGIDGQITKLEYNVNEVDDGINPPSDVEIGHPHFLTRITDPTGVRILEAQFVDNKLVGIVDASGEPVQLEHEGKDLTLVDGTSVESLWIDRATDPLGQPTEIARDSQGNVLRTLVRVDEVRVGAEIGGDNDIANDIYQVTVFEYDSSGRLTGQSQPFLRTYQHAYTALTQADIDAIVNEDERELQGVEPEYTEGDENTYRHWVSRARYDGRGNVLMQQDALGNRTLMEGYTQFGQPRIVIDPEGNRTESIYEGDETETRDDDTGQLLRTTVRDVDGALISETRYEYDERFGGVTRVLQIDDDGQEIEVGSTVYDDKGRPIRSTDADDVTQYTVYDEDGNPTLSFSYWNQPDELTGVGEGDPEKLIVTRTFYDDASRATETRQYTLGASSFPVVDGVSALGDASDLDNYAYEWSTVTTYDAAGRTTSSTDRFGNVTETFYNVRGQVVETRTGVVDDDGESFVRVTRTFYDRSGRAVATSDPFLLNPDGTIATPEADLRASYTIFDSAGRVIERMRLEGAVAQITLSPSSSTGFYTTSFDEITAEGLGEGDDGFLSSTKTVYDEQGRVFKTISATGVETFPVYDHNGRQEATITSVDLNGDGVLDVTYGANGVPDGGSERIVTQSEFDNAGRQILTTDALGNETTLVYDAAGRVIRTTFDDYTEVTTTYDRLGNRVAETNQLGETRNFEYDDSGRQVAVLLPSIEIDNPQNPGVGDTIAVRHRYEYGYDQYGNHTLIVTNAYQKEDGTVVYLRKNDATFVDEVVLVRSASETLVSALNAAGKTYADLTATTLAYDHLGRQTLRKLPDGLTEQMVYSDRSLADLTAGVTDPVARDALLRNSVGLGQTEYMVDFEGRVTAYRYDNTATGGGRQVAMHYYASVNAYLADADDGSLDQSLERVEYRYDALGRQFEDSFYREDGTIDTTTREYDAEGRTTSVESAEGTVHYEYDLLGRQTRTYTGLADKGSSSTNGDGKAVTDTRYAYDDLGRLASVAVHERFDRPLAEPEVTTYTYDKNGRLDQMETPGNVVTDYAYDELNRLDKQTTFYDANDNGVFDDPAAGGVDSLFASYDYTVREDGKRIAATEVNDLGHVTQYAWEYDALGRLVEERYDAEGTEYDYIDTFAFDIASNRVSMNRDGGVDGDIGGPIEQTTTYKYDANDRLQSENLNHVDNEKDRFTEYEFDGTTQIKKTVYRGTDAESGTLAEETTHEYNPQGRMSRTVVNTYDEQGVLADSQVYGYEYNTRGIRVSQTVNGIETVYLLDLQNHTGYSQVLEEKEWVDGKLVVTKTYTLGHDVLAQATADQVLYLITDGHGSTRAVYDLARLLANPDNPAAAILQRYAYDAYGALLPGAALVASLAEALTSHLYSGEQTDLTGLQYLRARYYNPATGQFNRLDPFFGNLEDPLSLHKYLYAHGDSVNGTDPTGEFLLPLLAGLVWGATAGTNAHDSGWSTQSSWAAGIGAGLAIAGLVALLSITSVAMAVTAVLSSPIVLAFGLVLSVVGLVAMMTSPQVAQDSVAVGVALPGGPATLLAADMQLASTVYSSLRVRMAWASWAKGPMSVRAKNIAGISKQQAAELRRLLLGIPGVKQVFAFGSRTKGTATAQSDLDIALIGDIDVLSPETLAAVRKANEYAVRVGLPIKPGRTVPLDITPASSKSDFVSRFTQSEIYNPELGVPVLKYVE